MRNLILSALLPLFVSACTLVSTQVVQLDPSRTFPPTPNVEVLLEKPKRAYTEIALLESRGDIGVGEADLLNSAREKAKTIGADAIVRVDVAHLYHPPVAIYDPWPDPFYWRWSRYRAFPPFPHPWGTYRVVGGGYSQTLKALAIKYND